MSTDLRSFTGRTQLAFGAVAVMALASLVTSGVGLAASSPGPAGRTGATGAVGATGVDGATGKTGKAGKRGKTGATGARGMTGLTGASGVAGVGGAKGSTGKTGHTGATGSSGSTGGVGISGYVSVNTVVMTGADGTSQDTDLDCPTGKVAVAGAYGSADGVKEADVWRTFPNGNSSWRFTWTTVPGTGAGRPILFFLTCATPS